MQRSDVPDEREKPFGWKDATAVFALRIVDSGLAPWALVAGFVLMLVYILTRNLGSTDNLALINRLTDSKIFGFGGWILCLIQLPIFVSILKRTKRAGRNRLAFLEDENIKARQLLKQAKQGELTLEQ